MHIYPICPSVEAEVYEKMMPREYTGTPDADESRVFGPFYHLTTPPRLSPSGETSFLSTPRRRPVAASDIFLTIEPTAYQYCRGAYGHSRVRLCKGWGNRCSAGGNPTLTATLCTVRTSFPCTSVVCKIVMRKETRNRKQKKQETRNNRRRIPNLPLMAPPPLFDAVFHFGGETRPRILHLSPAALRGRLRRTSSPVA